MRFAEGEIYHIYSKGVDGRNIFNSAIDYKRFLLGLRAFNNISSVELRRYNSTERVVPHMPQESLVSILSYILMKNHVHFLIKCVDAQKMAKFLNKIFAAYTTYFNLKYNRKGVLFQSRSKSKHIYNDGYLQVMLQYIILNSLDEHFPEWRWGKLRNIRSARKILINYPWSSLAEMSGKTNNFIIDKDLVSDFIDDPSGFLDSLLFWSSRDFEKNNEFFLE